MLCGLRLGNEASAPARVVWGAFLVKDVWYRGGWRFDGGMQKAFMVLCADLRLLIGN